jgi:two-component system invasion response regulator UvrY
MASIEARDSNPRSHGCVLAVDDQAFFRTVLRQVVSATTSLVVVGEADSGERAVELVRELRPDLVLMDVRMPGLGGIAATRRIKELRSETMVVLLSTTRPEDLPPEAEECSADEIVWKSDLGPTLLDDIWRRRSGEPRPATPSS